MTLAGMIRLDEDALICDLAETYHVFDYRSLPVRLVATLCSGLRDNSRIKMKASKKPISNETFLLAVIADRIELLRHMFSSDKGKPMLLTDALSKEETSAPGFATGEELEKALAEIRGK